MRLDLSDRRSSYIHTCIATYFQPDPKSHKTLRLSLLPPLLLVGVGERLQGKQAGRQAASSSCRDWDGRIALWMAASLASLFFEKKNGISLSTPPQLLPSPQSVMIQFLFF